MAAGIVVMWLCLIFGMAIGIAETVEYIERVDWASRWDKLKRSIHCWRHGHTWGIEGMKNEYHSIIRYTSIKLCIHCGKVKWTHVQDWSTLDNEWKS